MLNSTLMKSVSQNGKEAHDSFQGDIPHIVIQSPFSFNAILIRQGSMGIELYGIEVLG